MASNRLLDSCERFVHWIARQAIAFHLWCAEQELRIADVRGMSFALRQARARNLDRLRDYRRRRQFPQHQHVAVLGVPCFIDSESRLCAVAHLMHASGDKSAALKVAGEANLARIRDMHFLELDDWASHSGFTKAELARIQPSYAATPQELRDMYEVFQAIWYVGAVAIIAILVNSCRLFFTFAHRFNTSLLGILTGLILIGLCARLGSLWFPHTPELEKECQTYFWTTGAIAVLALLCAIIPFWRRPDEAEQSKDHPIRDLLTLLILVIAILLGPLLVYVKVLGPGSEWRFELVRQFGHRDEVTGVTFCNQGAHVVTVSPDGYAILWEASTGRRIRDYYRGHTDQITCVAAGDGKHFVTGSMDKTAVLWDIDSGAKIRTFQGHTDWIESVAMSQDGKRILTGSTNQTAILWDAASGDKLQTFKGHKGVIASVALSRDGKHALTGSWDGAAILWDTSTGKKVHPFLGHTDRVMSVSFSADGTRVLTGSWDKTAILWDAASGKSLQQFHGYELRIMAAAISADARFVITGSTDNSAIVWDAATGKPLHSLRRHLHPVICVAFDSDAGRCVTGSGDHLAILWDVKTGKKLQTLGTLSRY